MFPMKTGKKGEHFMKLPHLCPILCQTKGNNSCEKPRCAQTGEKSRGTNQENVPFVPKRSYRAPGTTINEIWYPRFHSNREAGETQERIRKPAS